MKQLIIKLFFTLIGVGIVFVFALPWSAFGIQMPFTGKDYKLWLDLQWGIELDYKIDLSEVQKEADYTVQRKNAIIEGLKSVIDKRIETLNINDSVITSSSYGDDEHIIVQIPLKWNDAMQNSENIERAKEAIGKVVKIEFKELREKITEADILERKALAEEAYENLKKSWENFYSDIQPYALNHENVVFGSVSELADLFSYSGSLEIWSENISKNLYEVTNKEEQKGYLVFQKNSTGYDYLFINKEPSIWKAAKDSTGRELDDTYFTKASVQYNQAFQPMIELTFNNEGAEIFWELTKRLTWNPIAIFVGGDLLTAPNVNEPILSGKAVITGDYTSESATKLANDINTWVVPAPIFLTSERTIDSRLWKDSLEKIIMAGIFSFVCILIFLVVVYRTSGFIAGVALLLYIILTLAILKQFWIVQTLASLGWLVLSIGMAIDANVLIFERMKDELRSWNSLEKSQKIGFDESFSAIWDSNVTGLIVSLILFIFWINMIKGFWLTLAIGIMVSVFSVYFVSRVFLKMLAQTGISQKNFIWKI